MKFRKQPQNIFTSLGLFSLVLAILINLFLHPTARLAADVTDGTKGLFYGLSIALLLTGLRVKARSSSTPCA